MAFAPAGTAGFDDLARRSISMNLHGSTVAVVALEDIIRSKEAANRPKDHRSLPVLRQLLEELLER